MIYRDLPVDNRSAMFTDQPCCTLC